MNYLDIMNELKEMGTPQAVKIYRNHGADIDLFGVSIANLKKIAKRVKTNHKIGLELLKSKNVDAMYLSQWILDPKRVEVEDIEEIFKTTSYYMLIDNLAATLAAKDKSIAFICLNRWINSENHLHRQAAYSLYSMVVASIKSDDLDLDDIQKRLDYIRDNIHNEENRVRYSMNGFVISVGIYIEEYTEYCKEISKHIGKVNVYMGKTSCKVPDAFGYIEKVEKMGRIGKLRKI